MDKKKKTNKKTTKVTNLATKIGSKSYFMKNKSCYYFLDNNLVGNVFYNECDRNLYQKWEFIVTDTIGAYYLKNVITTLYLTSNVLGDLTGSLADESISSYQKWYVYLTSIPEVYVFTNFGNNYSLDCNKTNQLYINKLSDQMKEDLPNNVLFDIFQKKPPKK